MLIFLDIDGVLVPAKGWKAPELLNDGFPAFSNKATRTLKDLISEDTTFMLTTSHKSNYTIEEWKAIFKKRGIDIHNIKPLENNINNLSRKDEVVNWFNANKTTENFIIIDDDKSLNELPDFLKKNLILTSPLVGLTDEHLEDARAILNKGLQVV
ncbi:HAD domain-containing protein [Parasediminibacterium sp. JCM 36343]|uniref:HAD domain-containing protein n=1 Tax=Parasediminibacterium sp. JCM 36343 TaxID=3374279 RepID=UPI00397D0C87